MLTHRLVTLLLCLAAPAIAQQPVPARPILIRGATVVDGSGGPSRVADVRISGGTIQRIGQLAPSPGDSVVEARGLVLAPGFIDTHSHHDRGLDSERTALAAVSQGITTIVVGQDGWSSFPLADWFAQREQRPAAVNVASYVGHGRLRDAIMGEDLAPGRRRVRAHTRCSTARWPRAPCSRAFEHDRGFIPRRTSRRVAARGRHGGDYISHAVRPPLRDGDHELITPRRVDRSSSHTSRVRSVVRPTA